MLIYEKADKVMTRSQLLADEREQFCDEMSRDKDNLLESAHVVYGVRFNWFEAHEKLRENIVYHDEALDSGKMLAVIYDEMKEAIDKLFVSDQRDYVMKLLETVYEDFHNKVSGPNLNGNQDVSYDFVRRLDEKLYIKEEEEYQEILWSGKCRFMIGVRNVFSPGILYGGDEDVPNRQLYVETVSKLKADRERECIDTEKNMFWRGVVSKAMLNLQNHENLQGYSVLKEFFTQAAWQLQVSTVHEDDFHENPIHYMLGRVYDPDKVAGRIGTKLVDAVQNFGFCIRADKIYRAQEQLKEVFQLEPELGQIVDDNVRALTAECLEKIYENKKLLNRVFGLVDDALTEYFTVREGGRKG